ncbi:marvel domain-containing protein [Macrophomina phaseolina]|uniref:Marvel domain-containing protein n=1 Tax=Macrophomina phaseolina TaxID=35725 RepID=A0ABQ8GNT9_9PEZI|nr:marvel domain-containing protein [Macrophomina phaseolina]
MSLPLINGAARGFQLICAAVVLGLSISLIKTQVYGRVDAINYAAFTGGFGMLAALLGIAAVFFTPLSGLIMVGVDALAALFLLAGGIAIAVKLRDVSCSSDSDHNKSQLGYNELTNKGMIKSNDGKPRAVGIKNASEGRDRCKKNSADSAFMIITAVICIGSLAMALLAMKRRGGIGSKGVVV